VTKIHTLFSISALSLFVASLFIEFNLSKLMRPVRETRGEGIKRREGLEFEKEGRV
jgi:hypothetical protein